MWYLIFYLILGITIAYAVFQFDDENDTDLGDLFIITIFWLFLILGFLFVNVGLFIEKLGDKIMIQLRKTKL